MPKPQETEPRYYLILTDGEQEGPYSIRELREMLQRDLISAESQVRSTECGCPLILDELLHETQTNTIDEITGLNGLRGFSLWHFFAVIEGLRTPR